MIRRAALIVTLLVGLMVSVPRVCPAQSAVGESARASRIKTDLRDILSGPEYRPASNSPSFLESIGRWIRERWDALKKLLGRLFRIGGSAGTGSSEILYWVVLIGLAVGLVYLIALIARRYGIRVPRRLRKKSTTVTVEEESLAHEEPDEWLVLARQHAEAGDFRRAYRAAFIAVLLRLDRAGAIRYERSRTNGDYLRSLRSRPPLFALMRPLANDFDARWYGSLPASEQDYRRCLLAYEQVANGAS